MRSIDADKTYEVLTDYYHHRTATQHEALKDALSRVPTIEPKHGRWVEISSDIYACSECNASWGCEENLIKNELHYCPNCGARMEKDE